MAHDLEQLKQDHPDVAKLFADDWLQYRKSEILPELTREAQSTCDRINRIYFEDTAEAERLFRKLVPEAGEGVDFRPPIRLDYGLGLKIGDRTFINMDLLIVPAREHLYAKPRHRPQASTGRLAAQRRRDHRQQCVAGRQCSDLPRRHHRRQLDYRCGRSRHP